MRCFVLFALACFVSSCWYPQSEADKERQRKIEAEEQLSDEVSPIVEDYFNYCYEGDMDKIFECFSSVYLENQQVLLGQDKWLNERRQERPTRKQLQEIGVKELRAFFESKKPELKMIGETAEIKNVKYHGKVFAIVEVEYVKGNEYLALIRQDNTWKIYRQNPSRFALISTLP